MSYEDAAAELEATLRRLLPELIREDAPLLSEWTLIVGFTDPETGANGIDLVTGPTTLISHSLGAVRFAEVMLVDKIRDA